jgi:hypothetical protein
LRENGEWRVTAEGLAALEVMECGQFEAATAAEEDAVEADAAVLPLPPTQQAPGSKRAERCKRAREQRRA